MAPAPAAVAAAAIAAQVGGPAPGEQMLHGSPLARRLQGHEDVGHQTGGRHEQLGAQGVERAQHPAVLGQLGLAPQARLDVTAQVEGGHVGAVDDAGQGFRHRGARHTVGAEPA